MQDIPSQLEDLRCDLAALRLMIQAMAELMTPEQQIRLSLSLDRMCDHGFADRHGEPALGIPARGLHRALNLQAGYMHAATLELQQREPDQPSD